MTKGCPVWWWTGWCRVVDGALLVHELLVPGACFLLGGSECVVSVVRCGVGN